jgi:hypothetical protein
MLGWLPAMPLLSHYVPSSLELQENKPFGFKPKITTVLVNYRRLPASGQRLRCLRGSIPLLQEHTCGSFEDPSHQDLQRLRQRISFALGDGRLFPQQPDRKF